MATDAWTSLIAGFIAWWNGDGMAMTAGASLAGLGAIAVAVTQAGQAVRGARNGPPSRAARTKAAVARQAEPLTHAATALLWRFKEILNDGWDQYLRPSAPPGAFYSYKRFSTAYRLAALLGCIRAIDRETHALGNTAPSAPPRLFAAFEALTAALADGRPLEMNRTARLCEVWSLPRFAADGDAPDAALGHAAAEFETCLRKHMVGVETSESHAIVAALMILGRDDLLDLFRKLAFDLARIRNAEPPSPNRVHETLEDAARALACREAWLYREWQRAIGDLAIKDDSGAIASLAEFEARLAMPETRHTPWAQRLLDLFHEVDMSAPDANDARPRQIRDAAVATAQIVLALSHMSPAKGMISKETLALAQAMAGPEA